MSHRTALGTPAPGAEVAVPGSPKMVQAARNVVSATADEPPPPT